MLYEYARAQDMTFGDAAAKLIRVSMLEFIGRRAKPTIAEMHFDRERKQVKVPKETHAALLLFASDHSMTIGDAAALLIGVGLMKLYRLDEDAATIQRRVAREQRLRNVGEALARVERRERHQKDNTGRGSSDT